MLLEKVYKNKCTFGEKENRLETWAKGGRKAGGAKMGEKQNVQKSDLKEEGRLERWWRSKQKVGGKVVKTTGNEK